MSCTPAIMGKCQDLPRRNPVHRLPTVVLAVVLRQTFLALDYIHNECQIIHTGKIITFLQPHFVLMACLDLKADNIMFGSEDDTIFEEFEKEEMQNPTPRKEINGRVISVSRQLRFPKALAPPLLCDFGSAVLGDTEHVEDVQPDVYRSPEVILKVPWSYQIDIWNVGCMVRLLHINQDQAYL